MVWMMLKEFLDRKRQPNPILQGIAKGGKLVGPGSGKRKEAAVTESERGPGLNRRVCAAEIEKCIIRNRVEEMFAVNESG
jgi:hypothetical protein